MLESERLTTSAGLSWKKRAHTPNQCKRNVWVPIVFMYLRVWKRRFTLLAVMPNVYT